MIAQLKDYDITNPMETIEASKLIASYKTKIKGIDTELEIREVDSLWIAISRHFPGKILGYYESRFPGYSLSRSPVKFIHDVSPDFIPSGLLIVGSEYIGNRVGTIINEQRKKHANELEKILLLMPGRPGEELTVEERNRRFPLTTEQLRTYYLRHGFKEFTEEEAKNLTGHLDIYRDRIERMLANAIERFREDPPYPQPVFGNTTKEKILKLLSQIPIIGMTPPVAKAVHKRTPWDKWREERDRIRLHENTNYQYVMSHLYYNGTGIDITKVNFLSSKAKSKQNIG